MDYSERQKPCSFSSQSKYPTSSAFLCNVFTDNVVFCLPQGRQCPSLVMRYLRNRPSLTLNSRNMMKSRYVMLSVVTHTERDPLAERHYSDGSILKATHRKQQLTYQCPWTHASNHKCAHAQHATPQSVGRNATTRSMQCGKRWIQCSFPFILKHGYNSNGPEVVALGSCFLPSYVDFWRTVRAG